MLSPIVGEPPDDKPTLAMVEECEDRYGSFYAVDHVLITNALYGAQLLAQVFELSPSQFLQPPHPKQAMRWLRSGYMWLVSQD